MGVYHATHYTFTLLKVYIQGVPISMVLRKDFEDRMKKKHCITDLQCHNKITPVLKSRADFWATRANCTAYNTYRSTKVYSIQYIQID